MSARPLSPSSVANGHDKAASESTGDRHAEAVYRRALRQLSAAGMPHLVGGSYAHMHYTRSSRETKDLDLFLRARDVDQAASALRAVGFETELTHPHWLGKAHAHGLCVDLIFDSGNGVTPVDDNWFVHARAATVLGVPVQFVPVEELIWSKAFVMERERYDGADVAHLLRDAADVLDWQRLLGRFEPHWRVLLSHVVLLGFIYPGHMKAVPDDIMDALLDKLMRERVRGSVESDGLCRGTLLSRTQYLPDVESGRYTDARMTAESTMTANDIVAWTAAALGEASSRPAPR